LHSQPRARRDAAKYSEVLPGLAKALLLVLTGTWAATNVYDRRHPKLGHPPFDWRRARPRPRPWAAESQTLLAAEMRGDAV